MDLHVTLASAPPSTFTTREIVVDTDVLSTGAALAGKLEAAGYKPPFSVDGVRLSALLPHSRGLHDGAVIVSGVCATPQEQPRIPHLVLVVHSGPDAGTVFPLTRGTYSIGRSDSDIVILDPAVSRTHALLTVSEDAIVLEDLNSVNGTLVDGEEITTTTVTVSADIRIGRSHCRIDLVDDPGWQREDPEGILEPLPVGIGVPKQPSRMLVLTALLPLVLGVVLAVTTGMWFFLAFSALSAVTGLVPLVAYRRSAHTFALAVDHAAEQDRLRRQHAAPDPGQTALDALRALRSTPRFPAAAGPPPDVVLLRIGTAHQQANLSVRREDGAFAAPTLQDVPLVVPCSAPAATAGAEGLTIAGEAEAVQSLVRALLLQVAHPQAGAPPVICWGSSRDVPQQARFLPNVRLTKDPQLLASTLGRPGVSLVFQFSDDLPDPIRMKGAFVIRIITGDGSLPGTARASGTTAAPSVTFRGGAARASSAGHDLEVFPDGVAAGTFDRTARVLARAAARNPPDGAAASRGRAAAPSSPDSLPRSASLWSAGLTPGTLASTARDRWAAADPERPRARLGTSRHGPVTIDLVGDGPHLLVAGTTGSGKSEFLRTLVVGLALDQPPEHLTLLLVDYKGGSGLGELAALPHCVGSMSDLSPESTGRAFVSLRAELRRREHLCAEHGADDLAHLRRLAPALCPPRLVVVIDEFRVLSDDVPTAVPELMRIAALGRSLGVHLVLATQRPQGAVTPDMRANITSAVLLRVQTAMESQDLLGSAAAADIPVDAPGRAFLRRGAAAPVPFQIASCSVLPTAHEVTGWQDIAAYLGGVTPRADRDDPQFGPSPATAAPSRRGGTGTLPVSPATRATGPDSSDPVSAATARTGGSASGTGLIGARAAEHSVLQQAAAALVLAASGSVAGQPRRPVLPPLPVHLPSAACSAFPPAAPGVSEAGAPCSASSAGSALALGIADFPERQEQRLLQWQPGDHSHLALIGLPGSGGGAALRAAVSALPAADPDLHLYLLDGDGSLADVPRDARVGAYVQPAEPRRAARVLERLAALPALPARGESRAARIVLAITGWGRWTSQFRTGRSAGAEEDLQALLRDGLQSGVAVLVAGDRELTASRFFPLVPNRIYLPLGAHQETMMAWPKLPAMDAVSGRGFAQGPITGTWGDGVCQLVVEAPSRNVSLRPPAQQPFPVHPLPRAMPLSRLETPMAGTPSGRLTLGVHGDDLRPYSITLSAGEAFLILGHRGSGRTNALRVIGESAGALMPQREILVPPRDIGGADGPAYWRTLAGRTTDPAPLDRCILLVDDADHLPADVQQILSGFVTRGAAAVLAACPGPALMTRVPLTLQVRGSGHGFVLSPRSPGDGDFFGIRLDVDGASVPGRGYALEPGSAVEVQLALPDGGEESGPIPVPPAPATAPSDPPSSAP